MRIRIPSTYIIAIRTERWLRILVSTSSWREVKENLIKQLSAIRRDIFMVEGDDFIAITAYKVLVTCDYKKFAHEMFVVSMDKLQEVR